MKPPTLTKQQIVRRIGQHTRLSNRLSAEMLDALIGILSEQIGRGGRIEIANFLTFEVQTRTRLVHSRKAIDNDSMHDPRKEHFCTLKCRPGQRLRHRLRSLAEKT